MKRSELFFSAAAVPLDYLALLAATAVAYQIRFLPQVRVIRPVIFSLPLGAYLPWAALASAAGILVFAIAGLYRITPNRRLFDELAKIALGCSTCLAGVMAVMFFTRYLFDSRFILLGAWVLSVLFVFLVRVAIRSLQRVLYQWGIGVHRLVLIGGNGVAADLRREFTRRPTLGYRIVAQFPDFAPSVAQEITGLAREDKIDEVVQAGPNLNQQQTLELLALTQEHHLDYTYTADLLGTKVANFQVIIQAGVPMVEVKRTPLDGWGKIWKRGFDIIVAAALIVLLLPLMAVIAVAVVLDSGLPALFSYDRVGERGRRFRFIKFRSMVHNAHQLRYDPAFAAQQKNLREGTPMIKFANDPRVTRVGRLIRRWSMDELPQLFLVLRGTMSLVGPRPHELEEVARYSRVQRQLLDVRPGITGLAQVSGRWPLDFGEEVKLDSYYIQNWSPWLDLQTLLKTPWAIVRRRRMPNV
ncbi:MAG: Exopolysaccharide biosynthesis polyprenyl glycosylphosphotransferase [Parcubacteria group bacterium Gr01-1014_31]|nr:MAG: Exopolysaccharide biosynthesis polyprenyl glycosylphosphotransferase [Parcubacteria group bacterium Gr01-1014_31]